MRQRLGTRSTVFRKNTKRGFITIEAAILLPVFFIGVLTFAYLIKLVTIQEAVVHTMTDEARKASAEAPLYPINPFYESTLLTRISQEHPAEIEAMYPRDFRYLVRMDGNDGMIAMDVDYEVKLNLPIRFYSSLPLRERLVFRGFIGAEQGWVPMTFEEMERDEQSHQVWIFPRAGGRYHREDCTYIAVEPREMVLSSAIRKQYSSCEICRPEALGNGNLIYCFTRAGKAYHQGSCPTVDRYVIAVEKDEAIERGYTSCLKCGGE